MSKNVYFCRVATFGELSKNDNCKKVKFANPNVQTLNIIEDVVKI